MNEDPKLCIVLEVEDPVIRSIKSLLLCGFKEQQLAKVHTTLNVAFYSATKDADPINDFPLLSLDNEHVLAKILEEG